MDENDGGEIKPPKFVDGEYLPPKLARIIDKANAKKRDVNTSREHFSLKADFDRKLRANTNTRH